MTLEEKYEKVRGALTAMVGAETKEELQQMRDMISILPMPDSDKVVITLNAVNALLDTWED